MNFIPTININIGTLLIDLTSEPFGHVVDKKYNMNRGSIYIKWQVTVPGQTRWSENIFKPTSPDFSG